LRFVPVGDARVLRRPGDAAGEVANLDGQLSRHSALDVPLKGVVSSGGKRGVDQVDLVLVVEDAEVNAGGVDKRVGPGELDAVDPVLDGQQPVLADHRDVFGVVDGELGALAAGDGHQVDVGQRGRCGGGDRGGKQCGGGSHRASSWHKGWG